MKISKFRVVCANLKCQFGTSSAVLMDEIIAEKKIEANQVWILGGDRGVEYPKSTVTKIVAVGFFVDEN